MRKIYKWLVSFVLMASFVACDDQQINVSDYLNSSDSTSMTIPSDGIKISNLEFTENHKYLTVSGKLASDIGAYDLTDSTKVGCAATLNAGLLSNVITDKSVPVLKEIKNIGKDEVAKLGLNLLVLVDLSLSQEIIDEERVAVKEMKTLFDRKNLYVAFMSGSNVSESYEVSDYLLDNYFKRSADSYTYLYRSMKVKMNEMVDSSSVFKNARYKSLVVLSGGLTYVDDIPVDPQHFELQKELTGMVNQPEYKFPVYYANFSDSLAVKTDDDSNVAQYLCQDSHGLYQSKFKWHTIASNMMSGFNIDYNDYRMVFELPSKKVFRGNRHHLNILFYDKNTLVKGQPKPIVSGEMIFYLGSMFDPVIVDGDSTFEVVLQGFLLAFVIALILYAIFQLLIPYIRYKLFKRNYVITYEGKQMSFKGELLSESCYLCKAPFVEGDEVVVKCKHTMHKECWDENDYHCPEHGRHCPEGSHYYNSNNLWDHYNASFYMKWILIAVLAGFVAWVMFTIRTHHYSEQIIRDIVISVNDLEPGSPATEHYFEEYGSHLLNLPDLGFDISFWLTFFLCIITVSRRQWFHRYQEIFLRAVVAGLLGYICFLLASVISIVLRVDNNTIILDCIPWALMSWIIMLAVTIFTKIKIRKWFFLVAMAVGLVSMYIWVFFYSDSMMDYRVALLLSYIIYSVGIALCIARLAPKSERYFLHVEGAIKEMDIALYKWLRVSSTHIVTIGKSVDCNIQLSWDVNGTVAPLQAEIRQYRGSLRLCAIEEGVFIGDKPLPVGEEEWLYHGKRFTIGNTTFTYIEKDL